MSKLRDLVITGLLLWMIVAAFQAVGESLSPMPQVKQEAYNADRIRQRNHPQWRMTGKPTKTVPPYEYEDQ